MKGSTPWTLPPPPTQNSCPRPSATRDAALAPNTDKSIWWLWYVMGACDVQVHESAVTTPNAEALLPRSLMSQAYHNIT